jgi:putative glutathione S-transferase
MPVSKGEFRRDTNYIGDRITRDGRDGWPVASGRYRLVAARACPWAHRAVISRRLHGLEDAISLAMAGPTHDRDSWTFDLDPGRIDPVLGIPRLKDAYEARFPGYPKGITVPAIVDIPTGEVVTNDFRSITRDLAGEWRAFHRPGSPDLFPEALIDEMQDVGERIYSDINNGVYRCGFAATQEAYERAYSTLFDALDWLEARLSKRRYVMGGAITEMDVWLWPTLVRFDAVYHNHFKCNRNKLSEMPALRGYARDLFQTPGFGDTVHFPQIKQHYYQVHRGINPSGIVPAGPDPEGWLTSHDRAELGGRPFGDGTAPGPPPELERVPPL